MDDESGDDDRDELRSGAGTILASLRDKKESTAQNLEHK